MHQLQDEDIIQMVLQGNQHAYAILVERYSRFVYTLALRLLSNVEDAEESTQDVFIKAYKSLSTYKADSKFSTWLYTITRNTCISRTRTNKQLLVSKDEEQLNLLGGFADSTMQLQERASKKQLLNKAIQLLPADEAQVITLFYIHEQTMDEISAILDITNSNAKVRLFRARKKLKEILDTHFKYELTEYRSNN